MNTTTQREAVARLTTEGVTSMSDLDATLRTISEILADPILSAEEQTERRCDSIIRDLDELCAMAANRETVDLVEGQQAAIGQMKTRVTLILAFLETRKPSLRVVSNNG